MILGLLLFAPSAVAVLMLGAVWQRRLHRFRVRAWVSGGRGQDRVLQGMLMLFIDGDPVWSQIEDFSAAVLGKRKPLVDDGEALWHLRVCLAVYRAARTRKAVGI